MQNIIVGFFYEKSDQEKLSSTLNIIHTLRKKLYPMNIEFIDLLEVYTESFMYNPLRDIASTYGILRQTMRDDSLTDITNTNRNTMIDMRDKSHHRTTAFDVILVIGGDGTMLKAIHKFIYVDTSFYGINTGSVGFLLNAYELDKFCDFIVSGKGEKITIHPLEMIATDIRHEQHKLLAINEISLLRNSAQSAHIQIAVNDKVRLDNLVADGVLLSTPAGSTAYNYAAGGPIIPLETQALLLTPLSPFRPRRWRGAVVHNSSVVDFLNVVPGKRPINATADSIEVRDVISIRARMRHDIDISIAFNSKNCMQERVIREQFAG